MTPSDNARVAPSRMNRSPSSSTLALSMALGFGWIEQAPRQHANKTGSAARAIDRVLMRAPGLMIRTGARIVPGVFHRFRGLAAVDLVRGRTADVCRTPEGAHHIHAHLYCTRAQVLPLFGV